MDDLLMTNWNIEGKTDSEKIICIIVMANPLVEIIYSMLYRMNIDIPVNQFFRICGFMVFLGFVKEKKTWKIIASLIGIYGSIWIAQMAAGFSALSFKEIVFTIKAIYATSLVFIFRDFIECNTVKEEVLIKATVWSTAVIMASICVSPFGLGYEAWEGNDYRNGYVGLFLFGNYLTVVLLIAFCLVFISKQIKHKIFLTFFLFLTTILLGNKAGLAGVFIYAFGLWIFYVAVSPKRSKKRLLVLGGTVILMLVTMPVILKILGNFIANQIQLYRAYGYTNMGSFLLSNRDIQISAAREYINENNYNRILGGLLGYGYSNVSTALKAKESWINFIEMDFYALRYYLGYFPVVIWNDRDWSGSSFDPD